MAHQFGGNDGKKDNADERDDKESTDGDAASTNDDNMTGNSSTAPPSKESVLMTVLLPNAIKHEAITSPPTVNQQIVWVPKPETTYPVNMFPVKRMSYSQVHICVPTNLQILFNFNYLVFLFLFLLLLLFVI